MLRLLICGDFAPRLDMIAVTKVLKLFYLLFFLELRNNYIKEGPDQNIVDPDPDSIYSKRKECLVSYIKTISRLISRLIGHTKNNMAVHSKHI